MGTLHDILCTFIITSRSTFLRMRNVLDQSCRENQNTFYVHKLYRKSYGLWDVKKYFTAKEDNGANIIWRMRNSFWMIKGTDTEYVILVTFPRERW